MSVVDERLRHLNELSHNTTDPLRELPDPRVDRFDPDDPRWASALPDPIAGTEWFASLSPARRGRYGLTRVVYNLLAGIAAEATLQQLLLSYLASHQVSSEEHEYVHHEIIEESRHTQMFMRFVEGASLVLDDGVVDTLRNDAARDWAATGAAELIDFGRSHPDLLFIRCLAVEVPVDAVQRLYRRLPDEEQHPHLASVYRIHIAEEARHVSYADMKLASDGPRDARNRLAARYAYRTVVDAMSSTPQAMIDAFDVPGSAMQTEAYAAARHDLVEWIGGPLHRRFKRLGLL